MIAPAYAVKFEDETQKQELQLLKGKVGSTSTHDQTVRVTFCDG
jgi:hypothetical protein